MRTFAISDIHGNYPAFKSALDNAKFDYNNDKLIVVGDICDRGHYLVQVINELNKIKNLVLILGNHDYWFIEYLACKNNLDYDNMNLSFWLEQGGTETVKAHQSDNIVKEFYTNNKFLDYYIEDNKLFVHAGIDLDLSIEEHTQDYLIWDRTLYNKIIAAYTASSYNNKPMKELCNKLKYDELYIGHTPNLIRSTVFNNPFTIQVIDKFILLDCGAGYPQYSGTIRMININTKEIF